MITAQLGAKSRMTPAADANDVMREQLEYVIEHAGESRCGCNICLRYLKARAALLELFREEKVVPVTSKALLRLKSQSRDSDVPF